MTDKMFNEVPVVGDRYNYGDWKLYAIHDDKNIKGFFGDYRWLSNFYPGNIWYEGLNYPNSECAYQAAKVIASARQPFTSCTPAESKKIWRKLPLLHTQTGWDDIKGDIMSFIVFEKFYRNLDLRGKLIQTGDKYLEETVHWHDNFFGVCICDVCKGLGQNNLGHSLMKVRRFWQNK